MMSEKDDLSVLTDEELDLVLQEKQRRVDAANRVQVERDLYVRFKAFAMCNGCKRALTEDQILKFPGCPYCGHESAEIIDHEGEEEAVEDG